MREIETAMRELERLHQEHRVAMVAFRAARCPDSERSESAVALAKARAALLWAVDESLPKIIAIARDEARKDDIIQVKVVASDLISPVSVDLEQAMNPGIPKSVLDADEKGEA